MARVSERRLRKLEWAACDVRTRRRWESTAGKLGLPLADVLVEVRRSLLLYALGLWPRYEQQQAAQAGCTVAELRREATRIEEEPGTPPTATERRAGGRTHAV